MTAAGAGGSGFTSVTQPAVSSAQHVATCITATIVNDGAAAGTGQTLQLMNGSVQVLHWELEAGSGTSNSINLCGLNVVGSVDTPMTLEIVNSSNNYVTLPSPAPTRSKVPQVALGARAAKNGSAPLAIDKDQKLPADA